MAAFLLPSFLNAIRWSATPRVTGWPVLVGIGAVPYESFGFFCLICPRIGGRPAAIAILPWMNTLSIGVRSLAPGFGWVAFSWTIRCMYSTASRFCGVVTVILLPSVQ